MRTHLPLLVLLLPALAPAQDPGLGFVEDFALALDRGLAVESLVPGTEDYYYYLCLERQHAGDLDAVPPLVRTWVQRHGRGARVLEIENRQALLSYGRDAGATFDHLRRQLGLRFDHQRQVPGAQQALPTSLDPDLISRASLTARALRNHRDSLGGFTDRALPSLAGRQLSARQLHELLERLDRPDVPGLADLVVRDLESKLSRGFGSLRIHGRLLLDQLEACATLRPSLLNEAPFVAACLARLRPSPDVQWQGDPAARQAYLEQLWAFAQRLAPAHNSLKSHVLNHRLRHDLSLGRPDKQRFLAWLRLPRRSAWTNPRYLRQRASEEVIGGAGDHPTGLGPDGDDEALLRAYLAHWFAAEDGWEPYAPFVREEVLSRLFAETKILLGVGDMERWYSLLDDPAYYEALQQRVEIGFPATQRTRFGADEPVAIEVDLKHVDTLLVKVFEIDALGYYQALGREVDATIPLDGLVAGEETTHTYQANPLRRVRRRFEFPALTNPGIYVIDFIGGGLSSRAVVRKGRLQLRERLGSAGHVFQVLDEDGGLRADAALWFGGREYVADAGGEISLPYSTDPGERKIILRSGALCSLERFQHRAEEYSLQAGVLVDREALLAGNRARLLVRPSLLLNGEPAGLSLLEEPVLSIASTGADGVSSTLEVRDLELRADRELVHEIQVPAGTRRLEVALRGRVQSLTRGEPIALAARGTAFELNGIEATVQTDCPLLGRDALGWFVDVRGKNGEPRVGQPLGVELRHGDFSDAVHAQLQTDAAGRVRLGALQGIVGLQVSGLPSEYGRWRLDRPTRSWPAQLHGVVGGTLRVPYFGDATAPTRAALSLLELRGGEFARDRFEHLALAGGFVELRDLPAGDYALWLKEADRHVDVRVTAGLVARGWAVGRDRWLEVDQGRPLQVGAPRVEGEDLVVELDGAGPGARVHLWSTRYHAPYDPVEHLDLPYGGALDAAWVVRADGDFQAGRAIGDEYRYVLERRYADRYPGNMLARPGLLLNPWALEVTRTVIGLGGGAGGRFGGRGGGRRSLESAGGSASQMRLAGGEPGTFPGLDFLPRPSRILANLRPDEQGRVRVPLARLGDGQLVHVVAVDRDQVVSREGAFSWRELSPRDRRLSAALDAGRHLTEQRRVEYLRAGETAVIEDVAAGDAESYDSLAAVFRLLRTLGGGEELAEFAFLLRWPALTPEEQRAAYAEHACHELHLFLHEKDPTFFARVVRPYLAHKAHKTFLDRWLLDDDLSEYLEPWAFGRLNVMERVLLARRVQGQQAAVARHVREQVELLPPDVDRLARLFDQTLLGAALEVAPSGGLSERMREARKSVDAARPRAPEEAAAEEDFEAPADDPMAEAELGKADLQEERDLARREQTRRLHLELAPTRRYVEHNYWQRRIHEQDEGLIAVSDFWLDFAEADPAEPFVSPFFAQAAGSLNEMLLALALLDLPFEAGQHATTVDGARLSLRAAGPLLLVRKDLAEAESTDDLARVLVAQDLFRLDERYRIEDGRRSEVFVTGEFLVGVAYGCRVVLTNPTAARRELEVLLQVPQGAIPLRGGALTRGVPVAVDAYGTTTVEYSFYFPEPGAFPHYPVHAGEGGRLVAFGTPRTLAVLREPSEVDTTSWEHVSQSGTTDEVLAYLDRANLLGLDLTRIAWRMRERVFFDRATDLLRRRYVFDPTLWTYGLYHADERSAREYLCHADGFLQQCGPALESPLVSIDPIERRSYQHVEYQPLVNARAHPFAGGREIANQDLVQQYRALLEVLAHRPALDDGDWLSVTYYLLLQDRIGEALASFARVDADALPTRLQYDYMRAYLDFFSQEHALARGIAEAYRDHPVVRWRERYRDVLRHLDEAEGRVTDTQEPGAGARGDALVATEPTLELEAGDGRVVLHHSGLERCEVRYYEMDVEFLFSTSPFVQQGAGAFAYVKPNRSDLVDLPAGGDDVTFTLPAEFGRSNVLVEVRGGGQIRRKAHYANALAVQAIENHGQLKVTHAGTGAPLQGVYVKVFARDGDTVRFHKDGYTDLRGRFDYVSVSGREEEGVERFALLVLSETDGAVIREVDPPTR